MQYNGINMPGLKPREKVKRAWSSELSYAIGLIATDGCLSSDGRHFDFTSKDVDLIKILLKCLGIKNKICRKISGFSKRYCARVQFGDVVFYNFLLEIGLTPAKSKTMGGIRIPKRYFFDFLRGLFDGDGSFYSYYDPRWKSSFMFYTVFVSASRKHINWLRKKLAQNLKIKGHITYNGHKSVLQLKYAKKESLKIIKKMYYNDEVACLKRKRLKVKKALAETGIRI